MVLMMKTLGRPALGLLTAMLMEVAPVRAIDTVIIGASVALSNLWPLFIGIDEGFLRRRNVRLI